MILTRLRWPVLKRSIFILALETKVNKVILNFIDINSIKAEWFAKYVEILLRRDY